MNRQSAMTAPSSAQKKEKDEYVGADAQRSCARQCVAQRGQSKNHRTEGADQSNFDPAHAEKDEAADRQGADHHHEHRTIDCEAEERDRSRTADRKLKLKFIGLLCRD